MTRYLLDTNIISNATKVTPSTFLVAWLNDRDDEDLFISAMSIAEIRRGILDAPPGRKRALLEGWFEGATGPLALFPERILDFDARSAMVWAELMSEGKRLGRPRNAFDTIIAAIAISNECVIVTVNERDFPGIEVINLQRAP